MKSPKIFTVHKNPRNTSFKPTRKLGFLKAVLSTFAHFCVLSLWSEWAARVSLRTEL